MATRRLASVSPGAVVLAAAIPILFLHVHYQPGFGVGFGSTTVDAYLSDFAVLAVVVAALFQGVRDGWAPLRTGRWLWLVTALFLLWIFVEVGNGHGRSSSYAWQTHLVTGAKFAEYALLAPAVPLVVRSARDVLWPFWSMTLWSCVATAVGVAQFFGADIFLAGTVGRRQASFLSSADFAALSAAVLLLGVVAIATGRFGRRLAIVASVNGALGMIVAGAVASLLGVGTALIVLAIVLVGRGGLHVRRVVTVGAIAAVVAIGVVAIRGSDLDAFARFLGASPGTVNAQPEKIQTYAHRTLLSWFGYEIWKDHPLVGVGWEGSSEPVNFGPYLPRAHARFPDEPPLAFPSADRRYGVQNVWLQSLADLGVIGLALWAAVFGFAAEAAVRLRNLVALAWIALLVWLWTAQGFIAGIPLDALTWLAFGLAATRIPEE